MNTRPLIITNEALLGIANLFHGLPADAKIETSGPTTGSKRGEMDGIYVRISSAEFRPEDRDKPIELK